MAIASEIRAGRMPFLPASVPSPEERPESPDTCSSSIGRNSDCSAAGGAGDGQEDGGDEVQSSYKGPLDTMDALEDSLPVRRSISKFYCGKSKSFTSLTDAASTSSAKDLAKPDNPYSRKRKNLLAFGAMRDRARSHHNLLRSSEYIAKRPAHSSRNPFTISSSESNSNSSGSGSGSGSSSEEEHEQHMGRRLPPLHPRFQEIVYVNNDCGVE